MTWPPPRYSETCDTGLSKNTRSPGSASAAATGMAQAACACDTRGMPLTPPTSRHKVEVNPEQSQLSGPDPPHSYGSPSCSLAAAITRAAASSGARSPESAGNAANPLAASAAAVTARAASRRLMLRFTRRSLVVTNGANVTEGTIMTWLSAIYHPSIGLSRFLSMFTTYWRDARRAGISGNLYQKCTVVLLTPMPLGGPDVRPCTPRQSSRCCQL